MYVCVRVHLCHMWLIKAEGGCSGLQLDFLSPPEGISQERMSARERERKRGKGKAIAWSPASCFWSLAVMTSLCYVCHCWTYMFYSHLCICIQVLRSLIWWYWWLTLWKVCRRKQQSAFWLVSSPAPAWSSYSTKQTCCLVTRDRRLLTKWPRGCTKLSRTQGRRRQLKHVSLYILYIIHFASSTLLNTTKAWWYYKHYHLLK